MEILTLLKANIHYRKGSFISVLILSFIISICLSTIISINYNIENRADISLKQNQVGDLVPIIFDVNCPDTMINKVKNNKNIDHIKVQRAITQILAINKIKNNDSTFFIPYQQEKQAYQIYNDDGLSFKKNPKELQPGEIYVPISFMRLYDCKIGDTAYLTVGEAKKSFKIKGFFEEPFIGCELMGLKLALMNEDDFKKLYDSRIMTQKEKDKNQNGIRGYYLINIYKDKNCSMTTADLRKSINKDSGVIDFALFTVSKEESKSISLMFAQIISGIMMAFLILLFIVILIVMGHSISTGIEMDYTNLGVLKAIGFGINKLRQVLVLEYILAELIGIILGVVGCIPAIYYLNTVFVRMTGLLSSVKPAFHICLIILAAVLLVSALFVYIKTRAIMSISPVCAISGGRDSIYFHSRVEIPIEGKGLYVRMAIRQLTSNLKQYISSTAIVAILVFFLVTITLLGTSMNEQTIEESFGAFSSDIYVGYAPKNDRSEEEVNKLRKAVEKDISNTCSIKKSFEIGGTYFDVNGDQYHGSIFKDPSLIKSILKGRAPIYDNEIVVTEIVAQELGVKIGDTVKMGFKKKQDKYIISGIFQSTTDLGKAIAMSYEGAKKIMPKYTINYVDYALSDSKKSGEIVKILKKKYKNQIETEDENCQDDFGDTIMYSMHLLNVLIYAVSILIALVVILIVCGKIFLKEQIDYGIYKALGFTSTVLRLQFALRFAIVAFIGSIFGIVLNILFNNAMMSALLRNIGITSFKASYNRISLLLPAAVLIVSFFIFAYLLSGKIKKVATRSLISEN